MRFKLNNLDSENEKKKKMELKIQEDGDIGIISVAEDIDLYNAPFFKEKAMELIDKGFTKILVNLAEVSYIDSTGLGTLVAINSTLQKKKGTLVVSELPESLLKVFEITKLTDILSITTTDKEARKILS